MGEETKLIMFASRGVPYALGIEQDGESRATTAPSRILKPVDRKKFFIPHLLQGDDPALFLSMV